MRDPKKLGGYDEVPMASVVRVVVFGTMFVLRLLIAAAGMACVMMLFIAGVMPM